MWRYDQKLTESVSRIDRDKKIKCYKVNGYTCRISAISDKGDNFSDFLLAFLNTNLFLKGVFSKRGANFFPFRVDPFTEGGINTFERVASLESVSIPLKNSHLIMTYHHKQFMQHCKVPFPKISGVVSKNLFLKNRGINWIVTLLGFNA